MRTPVLVGLLWTLIYVLPSFAAGDMKQGTCVWCHEREEDEILWRPVVEWRDSVHAPVEVSCDGCHGGDPREQDADLSMSEEAGFLENPGWNESAEFCGVCHEAIAASYNQGRFGRAIREAKPAPTCLTCHMHDGHRIRPPNPEKLHTERRCQSCLLLVKVGRRERALRTRIGLLHGKGFNLGDLRAELDELHTQRVESIHSFTQTEIEAAVQTARSPLEKLELEMNRYEGQAGQRRTYGGSLLTMLGILLVALVWYQRTNR